MDHISEGTALQISETVNFCTMHPSLTLGAQGGVWRWVDKSTASVASW